MNRILHEYRIHNCEVLFRDDCSTDDLIDVIEGNRKYIKCLYAYNKVGSMTSFQNAYCVFSNWSLALVLTVVCARGRRCNCICNGFYVLASQIDTITLEEVDHLARLPHSTVISVHMRLNLDGLLRYVSCTFALHISRCLL